MSKDWDAGLCDCFSGSWLLSWCCPCILYGRVNYRLTHPEDPELQRFDDMGNSGCWLWCCVQAWTGCGPCVQCFQRGDIRGKLGIKGNSCEDCLVSWCCNCCALVQEEQTLKNPANKEKLLGPQAYNYAQPQQQQHMAYAPQQTGYAQHPQHPHHPQHPPQPAYAPQAAPQYGYQQQPQPMYGEHPGKV